MKSTSFNSSYNAWKETRPELVLVDLAIDEEFEILETSSVSSSDHKSVSIEAQTL